MKVAIVHDYIKEYGGAERVLEELIKLYPDADIYTSIYAPKYLGPHEERFKNYHIKTTWLNSIPGRHKLISPLRLLSPFAFKSLDLRKYDVVIVSQTGAYFPNLVKHKKGKLICFTHTPPRYLYGYKTARDMSKSMFVKAASSLAFHVLRMVDYEASKNVDVFVANSEEVASRIRKFYRRDATVIYPPVSTPNVIQTTNNKLPTTNYYLAGGRLARAKGMDVIIEVFTKNKKPLKVFGRGFAGYENELKSEVRRQKAGNIEFLGEVTDEEKFELMAKARAFIFASFDEDFGITPVEAMGVGTPVVAFRSGGVKETVVDGKTGLFYDENTPESLNNAIGKLEALSLSKGKRMSDDCIARAEKFSEKEFDKKIREVVNNA